MSVAHLFGRVTKPARSAPASDAVVTSADGHLPIINAAGSFSALIGRAGVYRLLVTVPGYPQHEIEVRVTAADLERRALKTANVKLQPRGAKSALQARSGAG